MAIKSIQMNNLQQIPSFKQEVKPYRDAEGTVTTENNVKPLPPKGHLVDDDLGSATKYFFKDIGYALNSVKEGYEGTANDHQLGRLNDVGLAIGGTALATYLASRTTNPKARIMEYVGLATFLTSMALYPKIAINTPARILHGYDIDKQYIDEQGRKKSVQQDSNYVPYDMYMSGNKGEDLDAIGDRMGIPRDVKNRHDLIREQMRKIATQNNTLWMLTAGFATPLMTGLICNVLENYVVAPSLEKSRNAKYNEMIRTTLNQTKNMTEDISGIENGLGKYAKKVLSKYKGQILPDEVKEDLISQLTKNSDSILAGGIRRDVNELLAKTSYSLNSETISKFLENAESNILGRNKEAVKKLFPSKTEFENIIKTIKPDADFEKGISLNDNELNEINNKLSALIDEKSNKVIAETGMPKEFAVASKSRFIKGLSWEKVSVITEDEINKISDFAKILGDFKDKRAALDKCKNFKFEYAPETIVARYYTKFQNALMKGLGISHKDYAKIRDDKEFTKKLIDEKMQALSQNEEEYKKLFEKLGGIMADMDKALHGSQEEQSQILDLINGIENNYNNTAKRLDSAGIGRNTIDRLVKEDVSTLENVVTQKTELMELLDGIKEAVGNDMTEVARGKGSSKNLEISRLVSRYQGQMNSFFRVFHTMELYKRAANPEQILQFTSLKDEAYINELLKLGKDALLGASTSDYIMKFNMVNNPMGYKDLAHSVWAIEEQIDATPTKHKGFVTDSGKKALTEGKKVKDTGLLERFQYYISRAKYLLLNNSTDFTKPHHNFWSDITNSYTKSAQTNEAIFNLVGQSPVDMIQKGAARKRGDKKWLAIIGTMTGVVFGVTLLAQFAFGKISNRHNLQKQVNNETDKQNNN